MTAGYTLAAFRRFCRGLVLDTGRRLHLEPFQALMLTDHFGGATETVIVLPTGNAKTTLTAALALFHLKTWPEAEVVIIAASRDQARVLFRQAVGLIRRSGLDHIFDVKSGYGEIRLDGPNGPRIRVLAADVATGDGAVPTLVLVDELHRVASGELYGIMVDKLDKRDGLMVTISTAGARVASTLGQLRQRAHALASFVRDDETKHNRGVSDDGTFVWHEWCLDPSDDVDDMAVVKLANPLRAQTITKLTRRHASPSTTPWQWLRFACGIWTEGEEPWLEPKAWDSLARPGLEITPGSEVWVDVRVMFQRGAIVLGAPRDGTLAIEARVMETCSYAQVEDALRSIDGTYRVQQVTHGGRGFARSAELLEAEGLPMLEFPASPERMAQSSGTLYRLIESGELEHSGDMALRSQVLAGRVHKDERGWRLTEDPETHHPIEALIALAVVAQMADRASPEPKLRILGG